jgi:Phosphoesterase family
MRTSAWGLAAVALGLGQSVLGAFNGAAAAPATINKIDTLVVIYAENRSFDNLYGFFPGANGLRRVRPSAARQTDRDGTPLKELPEIWDGLTTKGVVPPITQAQTEHLANKPFAIDDPDGFNLKFGVVTRDLWHRFYENQMQIDGGKNDRFAAWADSGGLVMGHYDVGSKLPLWNIARRYTLADNFFTGAFGGSFLNHFWLICACTPVYPNADTSPAKPAISAVEADGVTLKVADNSPKSALEGPPKFVADGNITPDFYAVNTMQPPYQPSANKPLPDGDPALASPKERPPDPEGHHLGLVRGRLAGCAGRQERHAGPQLPVPSSAVQLFRRSRARNGRPRRAPAGRRPGGRRVHQGDRRRHAAAGDVLQAPGQSQRARRLRGRDVGRSPHRRCDRSPAEKPAMGAYADRGDLRREWRLLGPCRSPEGRSLGAGYAHPDIDRLALCQARLRRSHALRYRLDPALHHQALAPAGPGRPAVARRGPGPQRIPAHGRPHQCASLNGRRVLERRSPDRSHQGVLRPSSTGYGADPGGAFQLSAAEIESI